MSGAEYLKARALSYSRDARVLRDEGDSMWVAYQTIADELRKCAKEIEGA